MSGMLNLLSIPLRDFYMERCVSGLNGNPGKVVYPKGYREFESPSLRSSSKVVILPAFAISEYGLLS